MRIAQEIDLLYTDIRQAMTNLTDSDSESQSLREGNSQSSDDDRNSDKDHDSDNDRNSDDDHNSQLDMNSFYSNSDESSNE